MLPSTPTSAPQSLVSGTKVIAQASKTRWLVLLLLSVMYMITYMDRTGISIAAPSMAKEFALSDTTIGIVFSVFLWAYAIGQIPSGWLADRLGARLVLLIIVPLWSLLTALTAQAKGIVSLLEIRFTFGLAEAGAFPAATRGMQLWFPKSERGIVHGITHCFSRLAIAVVPFLAVSIMVAFGWRWIFYFFGAAGLLWSLAFYRVYRNIPEEHPGVNCSELSHIRGTHPDGTIKASSHLQQRPPAPWKTIFCSPNMWYIAAGYCCFYYGTYFYVTWFPTYLLQYRHLSLNAVGTLASLPLVAGMAGDLAGGRLTDYLYKKTAKLRIARRAVGGPAMFLSAVCLIPAAMTHNVWMAMLSLTASLFFLEMVVSPAWAVPMDVGGEYSGTVSGIMNMAGSLAASLSPIIFGILVQRGRWIAPFFVSAGVLLTGALIWIFLIDPDKSVVAQTA
ncbi:MAG: MFS transporter [Acidobacteria bacterium]|nr:MFS transporter [Acidobacteriota bacterium]MBV9479643.1 MFS transporter [Acidobacteriota bacterium]